MLIRLSDCLLHLERALLVVTGAGLVGLILFNVVTRAAGVAIYWVDELAIYAMTWLVFISAGHAVCLRRHVRVTLLLPALPDRLRRGAELGIDVLVWALCLLCMWMSWIWYDPPGIVAAGFDPDVFSARTFNFIYDEPTLTIGIARPWVWLVMPWFSVAASVHAGANIVERTSGRGLPEMP